ncbi:STE24 endopeptidase [Sphingomonas sp. PP-CE-1A-559]|uniref:M48 family metallopeptidase n=1 Tax=Sphingomonas sp. PP-CE-1A-559 TaxID=2135657 RepID=UPI001054DF32|nr:M48 family metallopeptidase [Sphingomonas sp. PP-CE-1A-559]TCP87998.1 STE24 endopeptidase [Sphingomonas sp. PP-CE-1A-559]
MIILVGGMLAATIPAITHAATPSFDVEAATRAYLDLLQGPARTKSDAYFEGGYWLPLWSTLVSSLIYLPLLFTGVSQRLRTYAERKTKRRWLVPAVYALPFVALTTLLNLPWMIYEGFVREKQYGLMNQTFASWTVDAAKAFGIGLIINALLFMLVFWVIRHFRRSWWLIGTGVAAVVVMLGALIAPVFIAPLFNKYTELPAGAVRDRIVAIAVANHIPAGHIYVSDASRQTKRISANVSGVGPTIHITLNDNLLERTAPEEVVAVMGHEMGHYVLNHIWTLILSFTLVFLAMFFVVSRLAPALIVRNPQWGVRDVADPAATPLLLLLAGLCGLVLTPVLNSITRHNEVEADVFGLDAAREPDGFAKVAMRLSEYRKISPGPVEEMLFFDHPSGENRVRRSMQWKKDHVTGATVVMPGPIAGK